LAYVRVTVRIPTLVDTQLRQVAKALGWQLADLQRSLTLLGTILITLSHKDEEHEKAATLLMDPIKPLNLARSLSFSFPTRANRRPYAFRRHLRHSTLITLSLPESFRDLIATHAKIAHVSRNELYNKCLQQGLLLYLKVQANALAAPP